MKTIGILIGILGLLVLASCASISGSKNQAINLNTSCEGTPMNGANCSITNDSGSWYAKTPAAIFIRRSGGDLIVVCKKDQLQAVANFRSSSSTGMWGNALAGGLIGAAVDAGTGAGYDYPNPMNINFERCPSSQ
jgi:uncharacterized protein YcfJ